MRIENDKEGAKASDLSGAVVEALREFSEKAAIIGYYDWEHVRNGEVIASGRIPNIVTTEGKNEILDKFWAGSGYTAAYYVGLISSTGWTAVAAGDTAAQINGTNQWDEAAAASPPDYDEATRRALAFGAAAAGSKATNAASSFTFNEAGTVKGMFVSSVSTKEGTTGKLISAGLFAEGDRPVVDNDIINVNYTSSLT